MPPIKLQIIYTASLSHLWHFFTSFLGFLLTVYFLLCWSKGKVPSRLLKSLYDAHMSGHGLIQEPDRLLKNTIHFELFAMKKKRRKHLQQQYKKKLNGKFDLAEEDEQSSSDSSPRGSLTDSDRKTLFYPLHLYPVSTGKSPCLLHHSLFPCSSNCCGFVVQDHLFTWLCVCHWYVICRQLDNGASSWLSEALNGIC